MTIGELFIKLGFKTDGAKLKDFVQDIQELNLSSILAVAGLGGVASALEKIMKHAISTGVAMKNFNTQTGLSAEMLQQWTKYAEQLGVSGDEIEGALKNLQSKVTAMRMGMDQSLLKPIFFLNQAGAGITGKEDPFTMMTKIGKGLRGLTPDVRRQVVEMMGLSDATLSFFAAYDEEKLKRINALNMQQIDSLARLNQMWTDIKQNVMFFSDVIGAKLSPVFEHLIQFVKDLNDMLNGYLMPALLGIGTAIIVSFIGPIGTAILVLIALIDDLYSYMEGKKSLFKPLWGFFSGVAVNGWGAAPGMIAQGASNLSNKVQNFTFHITDSENQKSLVQKIKDTFEEMLSDSAYQDPVDNR